MQDTLISIPQIMQIFDLFGTMAFAVTGAFKAIDHRSDIVGIVILSTITGIAGGVIRDVLFGRIPPNAFVNPMYIIITFVTAIAIFFLHKNLKKHWNLFLKFDAIGLGVFTIIGASIAYNAFGLNLLAMTVAGILTSIGGGILRDVMVNEIPIVFVKEFYASASFIGILFLYFLLLLNFDLNLAAVAGIIVSTSIRFAAIKFNWNLPKAR